MTKPVVLSPRSSRPPPSRRSGPDFEIRHCDGADRAELLPAIADVDAILVRSATKVDAEALAAATQPQGRRPRRCRPRQRRRQGGHAGRRHGRQRADVQHRLGRRARGRRCCWPRPATSPPANAALQGRGSGSASKYTGVELLEKTVGIVGLGRIGVLVAQRLAALRHEGHRLRPLRLSAARAGQLGRPAGQPRRAARRERLHHRAPAQDPRDRRPDRRGGAAQGQAHACGSSTPPAAASSTRTRCYAALKEGRVAGAGLDVFAKEPCTDSPAVRARERRRDPAPRRLHRRGPGEGRHRRRQVGAAGPGRRAGARRGQRLRRRRSPRTSAPASRWSRSSAGSSPRSPAACPAQLDVEVRGEITAATTSRCCELAALKGLFADVVEEQVSYVNAPLLAEERGIEVRLLTDPDEPGLPQRDHPARHARRRHAGVGRRHADRPAAGREARRDQRLRPRGAAHRAHARSCATPTAPASSARSAGCSARPASTSPACRSPARPRAARRCACSPWTTRRRPAVLEDIAREIGAQPVTLVDLLAR